MTTPITVKPAEIQKELSKLEEQHKENRQERACLFNLVSFIHQSERLPYFSQIIDQITSQFPCRILFIHENDTINEIQTSIAAKLISSDHEKKIICEQINIEAPTSKLEEVFPLLLPHIIPDLPIYLLWADDPTLDHPLFAPLKSLSNRLIFESDCSESLQAFAQRVTTQIIKGVWEVADLNWIRLESWRKVIKGIFNTQERIEDLRSSKKITLSFTEDCDGEHCHNHIPHYLHGWIAAQMGWSPQKFERDQNTKKVFYDGKDTPLEVLIHYREKIEGMEAGTLIQIEIESQTQKKFTFNLNPQDHLIQVQIIDEKKPNEPYNAFLMHAKWEYALAKEICYQQTSQHYCNMLSILSQIQGLA